MTLLYLLAQDRAAGAIALRASSLQLRCQLNWRDRLLCPVEKYPSLAGPMITGGRNKDDHMQVMAHLAVIANIIIWAIYHPWKLRTQYYEQGISQYIHLLFCWKVQTAGDTEVQWIGIGSQKVNVGQWKDYDIYI